jgi:hypothetical protein
VEIGRITVQSQPRQIVNEILSLKKKNPKKGQGVGPEFKPQSSKKEKANF